ncbi:spore coat protein JB [Scopulibacillus daqui]|uniref:Spore coat protein JB n=1 Tax=Scopulibacillus daqui TaxID=1469162 RepID=A0ABS2PZE2_9BACL|nr:spore coat protein CotJB [Scopulibacillus daqui]MBM7645323.1 spore coat protein JB [Scopulibacillus daqui]
MSEERSLPKDYYECIEELQAIDFVLVELTLYLDTHPDDLEALKQYNTCAKKRQELKEKIEQRYGPLQEFGNSYSSYPWKWATTPWPWQI